MEESSSAERQARIRYADWIITATIHGRSDGARSARRVVMYLLQTAEWSFACDLISAPPQREICDALSMPRSTVRRALETLRLEGMIRKSYSSTNTGQAYKITGPETK